MYKDVGGGKASRRWDNPKSSNCHSRGQSKRCYCLPPDRSYRTSGDSCGRERPSEPEKTRNTLPSFFAHVVDRTVSPQNPCSPGTSWCVLTGKSNGHCPHQKRSRHGDVEEKATWGQRQRLEWCSYKTGNTRSWGRQQELGEARENSTLEPLEGVWPFQHLGFRRPVSRTDRKYISVG